MIYWGSSSNAFPFYDAWYTFANSMRLNPFLWSASYSCREHVSTWEVILVQWQLMLFLGAVHETNLIPRLPEGSWCSGKQHTPDPGQGCIRVRVWLWLLISHKNNAQTHPTPPLAMFQTVSGDVLCSGIAWACTSAIWMWNITFTCRIMFPVHHPLKRSTIFSKNRVPELQFYCSEVWFFHYSPPNRATLPGIIGVVLENTTFSWMVTYSDKGEAGTITEKLKYVCVHTHTQVLLLRLYSTVSWNYLGLIVITFVLSTEFILC